MVENFWLVVQNNIAPDDEMFPQALCNVIERIQIFRPYFIPLLALKCPARERRTSPVHFITPAVHSYMVWQKIEVFEHYLTSDSEGQFTDCRPLAFFGCIKADLARFGIGKGD